MSDTFHGRSRESLIEEIRELQALNNMMTNSMNLISDFVEGKITANYLVIALRDLRKALEPKS